MRMTVWWPGMMTDVKNFLESCVPCAASIRFNSPPLMIERETPKVPWQHCAADYKGPIGGKYYFRVLIDLYSYWPEVKITKSTSFDKLKPALEESFGIHGISMSNHP